METKQVIIQNKEEERQFLLKATELKLIWKVAKFSPIDYIPSLSAWFLEFPYLMVIEHGEISWKSSVAPRFTLTQFLDSK